MIKKLNNFNYILADQALVSGVNFLTGILIARFLGIEKFGVYSIAWMAILFISSVQVGAISSPMMTIGPKQIGKNKSAYYGGVFCQQIIFSILTSILLLICLIIIDLIKPGWGAFSLAMPLTACLFFYQNQDFLRRFFFTEIRQVFSLIIDAVSYLGRVVILIIIFLNEYESIQGVLWVITFTSAISFIVGLLLLNNFVFRWDQLIITTKRNWILSKWLSASAVMQWVSSNFFILVAGWLLGSASVGGIKAAQNILGVTHILLHGFENFLPSVASRYYRDRGIIGLKNYLLNISFLSVCMVLIFSLLVFMTSDVLLDLFYGVQYKKFGDVLKWFSLFYILIFCILPLRIGLRVIENSKPIFIAFVWMVLFSVLFAVPIINKWGEEGVVVGMTCTQIIMFVCLFFYFQSQLRNNADLE